MSTNVYSHPYICFYVYILLFSLDVTVVIHQLLTPEMNRTIDKIRNIYEQQNMQVILSFHPSIHLSIHPIYLIYISSFHLMYLINNYSIYLIYLLHINVDLFIYLYHTIYPSTLSIHPSIHFLFPNQINRYPYRSKKSNT